MTRLANRVAPGLIVNADDLGIHPSINAGILSAYQRGILTSCTMLMTTAYLEETVRDYVRPGTIPIGIHLSLTLGKAAAPRDQVRGLVDDDGNLKLSAGRLVVASFSGDAGRALLGQIRSEFSAQLALAADFNLKPTHADSHQHVHMNPAIFALVEDLLPKFGIDRLRYCREPLSSFPAGADLLNVLKRVNPPKWALLRWRAAQVTPRLTVNEDFFGIFYSGVTSKQSIEALITTAPTDRSLELCIHPGFPAPAGEAYYPRPLYNEFICSPARQIEHDILVDGDVRALVDRRGLILRSFDGIEKR